MSLTSSMTFLRAESLLLLAVSRLKGRGLTVRLLAAFAASVMYAFCIAVTHQKVGQHEKSNEGACCQQLRRDNWWPGPTLACNISKSGTMRCTLGRYVCSSVSNGTASSPSGAWRRSSFFCRRRAMCPPEGGWVGWDQVGV